MGKVLDVMIDRYDVVHLHSVFLWPTFAAARAAHRRGVPYVVSPRGMLVPDLIARKRSRTGSICRLPHPKLVSPRRCSSWGGSTGRKVSTV
jgi:hypothetical protein